MVCCFDTILGAFSGERHDPFLKYTGQEKKEFLEEGSEHRLFRLIRSFIKKRTPLDDSNDLAEEIHDLMDEGQARGLITNEESHMVYGVLDLKEREAHSLMVPRTEISTAPVDATLGEIIDLVTVCGHTRIPIYRENIDQIVGILHAKDLLKMMGEDPSSQIPFHILRKPFFVPESKPVSELLKELQERRTHLAIVTDEYGGTAGIITVEDILEEIVGEILDEHDDEEEWVSPLGDGAYLVDARLEIEKLKDLVSGPLPPGDYDSAGGLVIHVLGRIPEPQERFDIGDVELVVEEADQRRIGKIRIQPVSRPSQGKNGTPIHTASL